MSFQLKILGSSSAVPAYGRNHTAQILQIYNNFYLIDCGEGTQLQLKKYKVKINKINAIFISHLHGDHFLGLFGLISTMSLLGRTKDLYVFGPRGLSDIITTQLKYSETILKFELIFETLGKDVNEEIFNFSNITVETIPLSHRIQCNGFLFREKPKPRKLIKEKLPELITKLQIADLKQGRDVLDDDGNVIYKNEDYTNAPAIARAYAYCSDTIYKEDIVPIIKNVDLLYHESTFLHEMLERAESTFHTTAHQAGLIAKMADVKKLIIGHYSSRYKDLTPFIEEAKAIFPDTDLAIDGKFFNVDA